MNCLNEVNQTFKECEIPLWLNFGTLLGIYRDGKLIDDDIDLATYDLNVPWNNSSYKNLEYKLIQKNYSVKNYDLGLIVSKGNFRAGIGFYKVGHIPQKPKCLYQENLPVNYMNHKLAKKFYYGFMRNKPTNFKYKFFKLLGGYYITHAVPTDLICPLKKIDFDGEKYFIPNKTKHYLKYLYGDNWKTPDPDFPHFVSEENIKKFRGTFSYILVTCPRCNHSFGETKHEQNKSIVKINFHCGKCGKNFTEKVFLKGVIQRRVK